MKANITLLLTCVALSAAAKHNVFAPELGLNVAKLHAKYGDVTYNSPSKVGVRMGFLLDARFSDHLSLQTGLYLTQLGAKNSYYATGKYGFKEQTIILNINYVQVPVILIYKRQIVIPGTFFLGAGPYFGYAIGGKYKEGSASVKLKFGDDKDADLKPFDGGIEIRTGYEAPFGVFARIGYQIGVANIDPWVEEGDRMNNRAFTFSVGYYLRSGKHKKAKGE